MEAAAKRVGLVVGGEELPETASCVSTHNLYFIKL